jgi:hypothetical protein
MIQIIYHFDAEKVRSEIESEFFVKLISQGRRRRHTLPLGPNRLPVLRKKTMRKEHPISYTQEMIRARREGRKSVTRRLILPQPEVFDNAGRPDYSCLSDPKKNWQVGDLLWIKEGWRCTGGGTERNIIYKADGDTPMSYCGVDDGRKSILHVAEPYWEEWDRLVYKTDKGCDWRSPRFMPKWAAGSWDEIVSISIEWLWDINFSEILLEGIRLQNPCPSEKNCTCFEMARQKYVDLWESIYAKRGYTWDTNWWVWRIEFKEYLRQGSENERIHEVI